MRRPTTIAITGANGFLGRALVHHFASKGWQVIALVRNPATYHNSLANVTSRYYDMLTPIEEGTLQQVDFLVHAAYIKLSGEVPDAYEKNLAATKRLLAAAEQAELKQIVFISSMSAHNEAISVYGRQKLDSEQLFLAHSNATVLRPGLILGNGGIVKEMSDFMRSKHVVPLVDGGKQPLQVVALYDLVTVINRVLSTRTSGLLTIATPKIYTYQQFYQSLARALRTRVVYIPIPYSVLMSIFRIIAILHIPVGVGADNLKGLKMLRSVDTRKDLDILGLTLDSLSVALQKVLDQ